MKKQLGKLLHVVTLTEYSMQIRLWETKWHGQIKKKIMKSKRNSNEFKREV